MKNVLLGTLWYSDEWIEVIFDFTTSLSHTLSPSVNLLGSIAIRYPRSPLYRHLGPAWDLTPNCSSSALLLTLTS